MRKRPISVERTDSTTRIALPSADIVLLYGGHEIPQNAKLIPSETTALFFEAIGPWVDSPHAHQHWAKDIQLQPVVAKAKELKIPIFYADPELADGFSFFDLGLLFGETMLAALLGATAGHRLYSQGKPRTRRQLLKTISAGLASAYFASPLLTNFARCHITETTGRVLAFSEDIHPESFLFIKRFREGAIGSGGQF